MTCQEKNGSVSTFPMRATGTQSTANRGGIRIKSHVAVGAGKLYPDKKSIQQER